MRGSGRRSARALLKVDEAREVLIAPLAQCERDAASDNHAEVDGEALQPLARRLGEEAPMRHSQGDDLVEGR